MARRRTQRAWIVPDDQFDYPGRPPLEELTSHRRREGTFLVLAAAFLTSCAFLVAAGTAAVIDLSFDVDPLGLWVPAVVPIGAMAFPLSFLAVQLVAELYGRRRASLLVWIGLLFLALPVGLWWAAARGADAADPLAHSSGHGLALLGCCAVAHVLAGQVFHEVGRAARGRFLWLRGAVATLVGQLAGWVAFALLANLASGGLTTESRPDDIVLLISSDGLGGYAYAAACALALALVLQMVAGALAHFLRVPLARHREAREPVTTSSEPAFVRKDDNTIELTGEESIVLSRSSAEASYFDR